MSIYNPTSDMLTRTRNAQRANKAAVAMPSPKLKCTIIKVLKDEGCIEDFTVSADVEPVLEIQLKYYVGRPVIEQVKRVSCPGLRVYKASSEIPNVTNGLGVAIVSTSRDVITDRKARSEGVGGESLCIVA